MLNYQRADYLQNICGSLGLAEGDIRQALGDVGLQWEASMSAFLGQTGRVKTVQMKEGKQVVEATLLAWRISGMGYDSDPFNLLGSQE